MSKTSGTRPSDLIGVSAWASELTGMPDIWTAYQFDNAVTLFGLYIQNKLDEIEPKTGKYVNKLSDLLADKPRTLHDLAESMSHIKGAVNVKKVKVGG